MFPRNKRSFSSGPAALCQVRTRNQYGAIFNQKGRIAFIPIITHSSAILSRPYVDCWTEGNGATMMMFLATKLKSKLMWIRIHRQIYYNSRCESTSCVSNNNVSELQIFSCYGVVESLATMGGRLNDVVRIRKVLCQKRDSNEEGLQQEITCDEWACLLKKQWIHIYLRRYFL